MRPYHCAKGGVDLIKDDHGLMNQTFSDYKDRVKAVCEAVRQGNEESGHHRLRPQPERTVRCAHGSHPLRRGLRRKRHHAGSGPCGFTTPCSTLRGIPFFRWWLTPPWPDACWTRAAEALTAAACSVSCPVSAARTSPCSPTSADASPCLRLSAVPLYGLCTEKVGDMKPIFPSPGGMTFEKVPLMKEFYGNDVCLLMGGGLFTVTPDLIGNCEKFIEMLSK